MKKLLPAVIVFCVCLLAAAQTPVPEGASPNFKAMRACSATVKTESGSGTGVTVVRKGTTYFWTCNHVTADAKSISLSKRMVSVDKPIGSLDFAAELVCASPKYDLSLCKVLQTDFVGTDTEFYADCIPDVGLHVYHVGSMLGPDGEGSLSFGILSLLNRKIPGLRALPVDQYIMTSAPGSSGGGIWTPDGRCLGLVTGGYYPSAITAVVPVRQMRDFAKEFNCEWALDPSVEMP